MWKYILLMRENENKKQSIERKLRDFSNPLSMCENKFVIRFRLTKEAFTYVLKQLDLSEGIRSTYIPPVLRLAITLTVLASGGYQGVVSNDFICPVSKSTVSSVLDEVLFNAEECICNKWIKLSKNNESCKQHFFQKYNIPGGCIDGTHITLLRPAINEHMFYNRKGTHSLNVMIICDNNLRVLALNAKYGGAAHDSFVWKESDERRFYKDLNISDSQAFLLGDSGYPIEPWLIVPYRFPKDASELKFNELHAKARSTVERCIGLLKMVWRILLLERKPRYTPEKMVRIANVCTALHNIRLHYRIDNPIITVYNEEESLNAEGIHISDSIIKKKGELIRNRIKHCMLQK